MATTTTVESVTSSSASSGSAPVTTAAASGTMGGGGGGRVGKYVELADGRRLPRHIYLVFCGSFNPPHYAHMRCLENARDYCVAHGANVVGGCLSPTNDAYAKPGLLKGKHRLAMCKMMCEGSKWTADGWEMSKHTFINTVMVLRKLDIEVDLNVGLDVTPMLVCGADLLDSFNRPGCWPEAHMLEILEKFGVLCVERPGTDTERFWTSPILGPHKANIHIIHQPITDALSSTLVRDNVKKGHSNKYLVPDSVIKYIADNNLFKS